MTSDSRSQLPAVDERLVAPETRYEIEHGRVVYVPPADEPHGTRHAKLAAVVTAHRAASFDVAVDMLTRTSRIDDIAPDVSVFPAARDAATGGRQLEQLAFEVASTESLGHAAVRAASLVARGVRRVFAIDVERERALEWSSALDAWSILDRRARIADPALAVPIPVEALLDAARADDAIARALREQRHPEFVAEREEGRAEGLAQGLAQGLARGHARGQAEALAKGILAVLSARGLVPSPDERAAILAERDPARLEQWLQGATSITSIAALLSNAGG